MNYFGRMIAILGISIAISMALTWYFGLFVGLAMSFAVFVLITIYIRKRAMRATAGVFGGGGGVNYVCIACGQKFKSGSCPRCGSKMRRADF